LTLRLPAAQASTSSALSSGGEPHTYSSMGSSASPARPPTQHASLSDVTRVVGSTTRFGEPSFSQSSLGPAPAFGQSSFGSGPSRTSSTAGTGANYSRAFMSSENVALGPVAASTGRSSRPPGRASTIPQPTPKPGVEYYTDVPGGLIRARRVATPGSIADNGSQSDEDSHSSQMTDH